MLFISQPVSQKQRACKDSAENQGITELGHRLCDRCIVSEDCECHRKKDDQAADIEKNRISLSSPLAKALIGKETGDIAEFSAPGGKKSFEIVEVIYK